MGARYFNVARGFWNLVKPLSAASHPRYSCESLTALRGSGSSRDVGPSVPNDSPRICWQRLNRELFYAFFRANARAARTRGCPVEESLVNVEFLKSSNRYIARIQSEIGGMREYTSNSFEEVLEQVVIDLQEEAESYE